ncbi:MAG: imidazolonepropionase, partial [Chloroflexi bacterium]
MTGPRAATRAAGDQELTALALARLDRFLGFGVTTVEAKTGYGLTEAEELRLLRITAALEHPVNVVPTLLAAHVIPPESDAATWIDAVCERV